VQSVAERADNSLDIDAWMVDVRNRGRYYVLCVVHDEDGGIKMRS
jgi:hypothetical protein